MKDQVGVGQLAPFVSLHIGLRTRSQTPKRLDSPAPYLCTCHGCFAVNIAGVNAKKKHFDGTFVLTGKPRFPAEPEIPEKPFRP